MTLLLPTTLLCLIIGLSVGLLYFTGLWWTVVRLATARRPALWVLASFILRTGLVLAVFSISAQGRWERFLACLAGFILARVLITRRRGRMTGRHLSTRMDG
jgi:F1F0 ATPase subunit 2